MQMLRSLDIVLLLAWLVVDNVVVFSRHDRSARRSDRLSLLVIGLANWTGLSVAIALAYAGAGSPGRWVVPVQVAGLALFAAGAALRSVAIVQLGRFHMPTVAVASSHTLMDTGLYRHVRHPSYLGGMLALAGFSLALGSWVSPLVMLAFNVPAYLYRIRTEEQALLEGLGQAYADYCRRTRRLVPGLY